MAAQWYCLIGQQQYGPFTGEQIRQLVQQGQLLREHGVRTETDSRWTAAGELPGLFPPAPSAVEPQAATGQPAIPSVTVKPKKKPLAPAVSLPPAAPAPVAPPAAGHVVPAGTALPAAAAPVAAPVAKPAQAVLPAAVPIAAAPVARAVAPAAAPVPVAQPAGGPRPVSAARPIPVNPLPAAPPAGGPRSVPPEGGAAHRGRGSRKKTQMLVGGLGAAFVLLVVVAVIVITSGPGKKPGDGPARTTAAAKGGGDPEIEAGAVAAASPEPAEIADPVQPLAAEPRAAAPADKPSALPAVRRWLDATRQKAILRDVVRLAVGHAWLDSADGQPATLHVEIEITNLSRETPLEFSGWRPDTQPQPDFRAVMEDDSQTVLAAAPARAAPQRRSATRRIAPGQSDREQVSFVLPDRDAKKFRLALPYAALGQTGCLGFELPSQMIKDQPPGAKEPARKSPPSAPETSPPTAEDSERPADDEPESTGPRGEETEASADSPDDAMPNAAEPAAEEPPSKEQIPDIRKLIEEDRRKRTPEDSAPSGEATTDAP